MFGDNNYGNGFGGYMPVGGVPPMAPYGYPSPLYPFGMTPPNQQPQQVQQAQQQAQQAQQNPNTNKMYVNGIEDVRSRQFPFNSDYILLDNDKPIIYRRVTDGTGKMDVQAFKLVPLEEQQPAPQIDTSQFVLKSDLESFKKDMEQKISSVKSSKGAEKHD